MDDDTTRDTPSNDPRLGRFIRPRTWGFQVSLKPGSDAGNWRSALLILTLSVVIIEALTYLFHLNPALVYVLLAGAAILAALVWNQVLGRRR